MLRACSGPGRRRLGAQAEDFDQEEAEALELENQAEEELFDHVSLGLWGEGGEE